MRNLLLACFLGIAAVSTTDALGDRQATDIVAFGATLEVVIAAPVGEDKAAELVDWIRSAAGNVSLAYGRFPIPASTVVIVPGESFPWSSDRAVPFGRVTRRGGETVELFVNIDRPIGEFYDDWTATHEFSHLLLPSIYWRERWIGEGFASYYQNVLLARAGQYSQLRAWRRLAEGFDRGMASRPELSPNQAGRGDTQDARMKIYWSGAALALLADVELRERSGGRESLDTVLEALQQCCLPASRRWSGTELFRKLDTFIQTPVFMPLYRRYANTPGFPDVDTTLARLGVQRDQGEIRLLDDAELATLREAISGVRLVGLPVALGQGEELQIAEVAFE